MPAPESAPKTAEKRPPAAAEPAVTAALEPTQSAVDLVRVLDDYLDDLKAGKAPNRASLLAAHPNLASQLEQCLAGIEFIHRAGRTTADVPTQLGDFRIRREIGRGGMGVVYEAEQLSLHRMVALKILRFGAVTDKEAIERFRNEAETVARLHHTNIVPIFAVGNERGVNFYAMQFIEGQSLADVIQRMGGAGPQSAQQPGPLSESGGRNVGVQPFGCGTAVESNGEGSRLKPELQQVPTVTDIAGWGLQAAEALAHAHGRGVIHRDIKPSNLLLDNEGTLWLTDFGLAKRTDDVARTLTGAILGTPRYMSPEQATSSQRPVDHRTDIYSLGATLYELVTGQPVFAADTPHGIISQIITAEPRSPRYFQRSLPRDLETIVMKCLAKEPTARYQSARELADDLRAFLDGRPIAARRLSKLALVARWAKKHRRTVGAMSAVAGSVVILLVGGFLAWRAHEESQFGKLNITTSGPSLVAEVLDNDDRQATPSFPVPSSQPVSLREGNYQVRLSSPGVLSQTYPVDIAAGTHTGPDVQLEDRWMWPPMELKPGEFIEPVSFGPRSDLLVYRQADSSIRRLDGRTGTPVWPSELRLDKSNLPPGDNLDEWQTLLWAPYFNPWSSSWLAAATVDLDGDGEPDLVFASRKKPAMLAVSGKTGKVLWRYHARPLPENVNDLTGLMPIAGSFPDDAPVIGKPVVAIGSSDKGPTVVAAFSSPGAYFHRADNSTETAKEQTWIEAVSGKAGAPVWRYKLPETLKLQSAYYRLGASLEAVAQPQIARIGSRDIVICTVNSTLYGIDLEAGKDAWPPFDLGFSPDAAPKIVALADGRIAAIFQSGQLRNGSYNNPQQLTMTAISLSKLGKAWETKLDSVTRRDYQVSGSESSAPREIDVAPLGPKGAPAIVAAVTHTGPTYERYRATGYTRGRLDLTVRDPSTGDVRWEKTLCWFGYSIPPVRWLVGDDLDADGYREVFAVWVGDSEMPQPQVIVAALSGRDGHFLWRWAIDGTAGDDRPPPPLCWWQQSESGRPLLVVPVSRALGGQPATYILDSARGRLQHTLTGVANPRTCDLNGDGLLDLFYSVEPQGFARLMAVRGEPPASQRWLDGRQRRIAQDFDGDGLDDLLIDDWGGPAYPEKAVSSRDGRTLWRIVRQMGSSSRPISASLPIGDLAGDGRPSLLAFAQREIDPTIPNSSNYITVSAFSGRDGHRLWPSPGATNQVVLQNGSSSGGAYGRSFSYPCMGLAQLDPHKPADVLVSVPDSLDPTRPQGSTSYSVVWLNVVAGDTGKLRWKAPFVHGQFGENGHIYQDEFQDLNGDGVADIVGWALPANAQPGITPLELKAFSGVDGAPLWTDAPPITGPAYNEGYLISPVAGKLDQSGAADLIFIRRKPWDNNLQAMPHEVVVIGGRDGRQKWTWSWLGQMSAIAPPQLVDFDGAGRNSVCLFITEIIKTPNSTTYQPRLVILDGAGKVRKKIDAKGSGNIGGQFYGNQTWWRAINISGGPKQALLFFDERALQAIGGDSLEPIWKWPLAADDATIVDVLPAGKQFPSTIAIWSGKSIYGLSCETGRPRWRGEMPTGGPSVINGETERVIVRDANGQGLPRLLWGDGCRFTWPTDDDGRYLPPRGEPTTYAPVSEPVSLRNLPWSEKGAVPVLVSMIPWAFLWFVVPALLIRRAINQNSWRLAFLPAFYQLGMTLALNVIPLTCLPFNRAEWVEWVPNVGICFLTAMFLVFHIVWMLRHRLWAIVDASAIYAIAIAIGWSQQSGREGDHYQFAFHMPIPASVAQMIAVLAGGLPLIAAIVWIVNWLRRWQWRRVILFLLASIVASIAIGTLMIALDRSHGALDSRGLPEDQYSWDGWWLIPIYGVYGAAALGLAGMLAKRAFLWCRRTIPRLFARFGRKKIA